MTSPKSDMTSPQLSELDAALETLRDSSPSNTALGNKFERIMCRVLLDHPGEFRGRFTEVVPWKQWPGRDGPDTGIDLIATDIYGDRWAIQTKCYENDQVRDEGVDSFLAKANIAQYQQRMFISTSRASQAVTQAAKRKLRAAGCRVLYHGHLAGWPVPWTDLVADPDRTPIPRVLYEPHPYQTDAVEAVAAAFDAGAARGQMILPCGTGKSVVALWIAERLVAAGGTVLYVVPSISLLGQTMREWARAASKRPNICGGVFGSDGGETGRRRISRFDGAVDSGHYRPRPHRSNPTNRHRRRDAGAVLHLSVSGPGRSRAGHVGNGVRSGNRR